MTEFLVRNWPWLVVLVLFLAMHRSGHGCSMHADHRHGAHRRADPDATKEKVRDEKR